MGSQIGPNREGETDIRFTVLGLFEDTLDTERALVALRRAKRNPADISILLRDRDAEPGSITAGAVPRAVNDNTLSAVGAWLVGLAELVLKDGGSYLVAGPIGAAISAAPEAIRTTPTITAEEQLLEGDEGPKENHLGSTLLYFGFSEEEARYISHRISAGDAVVALTTPEPDLLRATRSLFADSDAVHVGQAQTNEQIFRDVQGILTRPAKATSEIVIADAVDPFLDYCLLKRPPRWVSEICAAPAIDSQGSEIGNIEEMLGLPGEERDDDRLRQTLRYVVVSYGRILGLGKRRVAIPRDLIDLDRRPLEVRAPLHTVRRAPAYDPNSPFSRKEEQAIFDHFGAEPYWAGRSAKPSPA